MTRELWKRSVRWYRGFNVDVGVVINVKSSPAAEALKRAPDEAIARAIHDALVKQKEGK
jgi:hypothetical protein